MAYAASGLYLLDQGIEGAIKRWAYYTADDLATVLGSAYFSDGHKRGMRLGDIVEVFVGTINTAITTSPSTAAMGAESPLSALSEFARCQVSSVSASAGTATVTTLVVELAPTTGSLLTFFGATAIGQRASSAQAAVATTAITSVATTAPTSTTPHGYTSAQAGAILTAVNSLIVSRDAIIVLLNQIRSDLVAYGLEKGSA